MFTTKLFTSSYFQESSQMSKMDQCVSVTSSWSVQGPYDINSILQNQHEEESSHPPPAPSYSIKLVPPSSTNDDDDNSTLACQLVLACQSCVAIRSVKVISSARHVELYDNLDAYCCTTRGERLEDEEGEQRTDVILYSVLLTLESPVPLCRLKFVSLTNKHQLTVSQLWVTSTRTEAEAQASLGGRGIDMAKVRDIMASLEQPIPPNVQSLMQTVEQYQKNQASVLEDFQQAATARLSQSGSDPKASLASNMAGILSAFSKASSLQQTVRTPAGTGNQSGAGNPDNDPQVSDGSSPTAWQRNTDNLSKLMASFGLGNSVTAVTGERSGLNTEPQDMFTTLQTMCREVSHMRALDRQAAERSYGPDRRADQEERESGAENTSGLAQLEQRLMGCIAAVEERIMGRMDRQMELLRDHVDLRFNKLEALLEGRRNGPSANAAGDGEMVSEDLD